MKRSVKSVISIILVLAILMWFLPVSTFVAMSASDDVVTIANDYITVNVSGKNGGFEIKTVTGDKLKKSDDNKALLYHRDEYDTSFTSFEVTYGDGTVREYLFGGSYGFLGMSSSAVEVQKLSENEIVATWSLNDLTFTQVISLVNPGANEHGMVSIAYYVENKGSSDVNVRARLLLDTALGNQDYGCYQIIDEDNDYRFIQTETVITAPESIPQNFFASDDPYNPAVTAYTVNKQGQAPYQVAIGHWNNLASSMFSFAPDNTLDFTDPYNKFLTADSAYALYYDMGSIPASGEAKSLLTYYGIYSHQESAEESTVTVDITAPSSLTLNNDKTAYVSLVNQGKADFAVQMVINNLSEEGAKNYGSITLAMSTPDGIMPLYSNGETIPGLYYSDLKPYTVAYSGLDAGNSISETLMFSARPNVRTEFRKIKLQVFDTSSGPTLTEDKLLAEKTFYVLCPGTDGELPMYTFTKLTNIIYHEGTRHLFLTGTNIDMLYTSIQKGDCIIKLYQKVEVKEGEEPDRQEIAIPRENVFQPEVNKLDIVVTEKMVLGEWFMQLEWSDNAVESDIVPAKYKKQTAPALNFIVSDNPKYKNDTYGVIAVVQTKGGSSMPVYRIRSFRNESEFQIYKQDGVLQTSGMYVKDYVEILIELRGEFEIVDTIFDPEANRLEPSKVKATSTRGQDGKISNCITINNCIDFEEGVLTLFYLNSGSGFGDIQLHFDGALYTSDSRTSIWKGEAAFTTIAQGTDYGLVPYDENGERQDNFNQEPITLIWPSVFGTAQSLMGMAFNLAYGKLGVMLDDDDNEIGRVISFGAKLDLGFLIPGGKSDGKEDTYWTRLQGFWRYYNYGERGEYADWQYCNYDKNFDFSVEQKEENDGAASIMVEDILFGCGAGFIGFHFKTEIGIPNYVDGMPNIKGELEVNTIGNWSAALKGEVKFATFALEAELALKSYKNIPIPDKLYLFVSGFEPGVNVDGHAILWITGGGGGIDNIYDTIFLSGGIPPLKLLLSVSFDLLKVLTARADLSLSPRGISFTASDIGIKYTNIIALKKATLQFDWYPDAYLMGSIQMSLFDIIKGSGYIVLQGKQYNDWLFEAFVRAVVQIPDSIPIVGGMKVGQVDLGISTEKVWGKLEVLFVDLGVTYYWGGDFDWGSGQTANPTFPDLLGLEEKPVYYDKENDRTLYIRVGTNISDAIGAEITDNLADTPRLMGAASLISDYNKRSHRFNLGTRSTSAPSDAIIMVKYDATSLEHAQNIARTIIAGGISDENGNKYQVKLYDGSNLSEANGNVTYDELTRKGSFVFTMTDGQYYDKDWSFTTPVASDIILYNVDAMPEITSVSGSVSGNTLNVTWSGTQLADLDSVRFYLVPDKDVADDCGYPLDELKDGSIIASGSKSYSVPLNVPSGTYYIRAVYSQDGIVNSVVNSDAGVDISNAKTPGQFEIVDVKPAGDLKLGIEIDNPAADAYIVNVYKKDPGSNTWSYSDVSGVVVEKGKIENNTLIVGGSFLSSDPNGNTAIKGLAANTDYRIGVIACNYADSDNDQENDTQVLGNEFFYSSSGNVTDISNAATIRMPNPAPPVVNVTADKVPVSVRRVIGNETRSIDVYKSGDITFTVTADKEMTGSWDLDGVGNITDDITGNTATITLTDLTEGDHTLVIRGTGPNGDGFRHIYNFTVDTLAPRLLLSSPSNGSFFNEDGTLTVKGITDTNARFSISCDNRTVYENRSIQELGGSIGSDGSFSFNIPLPDAHNASSHKVTITVSDDAGNTASEEVEVVHGGLSNIKSLDIYVDGVKWDNSNISSNPVSSMTHRLSLAAQTNNDVTFYLTDENIVSWNCIAVEGTASIGSDGTLSIGADSAGFVTGSLRVAETASRTSSISFGAEQYSSGYSVITSATSGGQVNGGGSYAPGDTVTLTAIPDSGYYFTGWTLTGVNVEDTSATSITFTMPEGNVVATANFAYRQTAEEDKEEDNTPDSGETSKPASTPGSGETTESSEDTTEITPSAYSTTAAAEEKVTYTIPPEADAKCFVPYYLVDGRKVYIPMSSTENGVLTFLAPVNGEYFMEERDISFSDTKGHWANDYIRAASVRGLFVGIDDGRFDPDGDMTRAMFVTVLWRLAGEPDAVERSEFRDAVPGSYYSEALVWAAGNGLVNGYGNGIFGVNDKITREQMCVIFARFLAYLGYDDTKMAEALPFADHDVISSWAAQSVELCRRIGIVNGKPGNMFDPAADTSRAECCAMFIRMIMIYLGNID